jgi:hypothetical protein
VSGLEDPGDPVAYAVLASGTPVYSSDEVRFASVTHVLAAEHEDIFEGIIVGGLDHEVMGHGAHHRFVDESVIDRIYERAVLLTLDAAGCRALPEPSENPGELSADPTDQPSAIGAKLRRAWDTLSGNR